MKDNLFEMLLNLFEKSLTQLQKSHESIDKNSSESEDAEDLSNSDAQNLYVKSAQHASTRVLTYEEQMKLTKASYQFLMRMQLWNIIDRDVFETIINQLQFSESRIVTLEETKWTIRSTLAAELDEKQLTFLDLVLYRIEDDLTTH
ncbi:DUF494 family protein [Legionella fallonii]|uniref:Protein Smg homolog n=1 Tax=Legionella fallonii LLAP-10 TaxID=1212491 RepID=A0A098G7C3_9GAMM|nr:DUF494 family protein [Legionella fallonii]CEG57901.1 conserved protein of unknown function [Legionella fallonii LLAP-10]